MTSPVRERVEAFVENHPGAGVVEILGRLDLDIDQRDLVEDVLDSFDKPNGGSSPPENEGVDVPVTEQCANPYCHERRVSPHPDSLCPKHFPRSTPDRQASVGDSQGGNA